MVSEKSSVLVVKENPTGVPPLPPIYVSPRKEVKRPKKGDGNKRALFQHSATKEVGASKEAGGEEENFDDNTVLAGSSEERRRVQ